MITLFGANDVLRMVTTSAANIDTVAGHATRPSDGSAAGVNASARATIAAATTTTLVTAAGSGNERAIYSIILRNRHASLANTITLQAFDGTTAYEIFKVTLAAGEQATFDGLSGWTYFNAQGLPKSSQSQGSSAAAVSTVNLVVLAADVINNNATLNTMQDVTGLSFPVIAGQTFHFEFFIDYTAAATTTGSRWAISGPGMTRAAYQSSYALTTTSLTFNNVAALDQPAASNATSANTTGNLAWIAGLVTPAADGNVIARFASEIANSAITAKAGSLLKWTRTL
jgi:hypothetical protein